ncbi:hypothetical protein ACFSTC_03525 [Nonomuraea ferruginea]
MAEDDLDLVLHVGDYIYENGVPANGGTRQTTVPDYLSPPRRSRWSATACSTACTRATRT